MDTDDELDLMLLAVLLIKKQKRRKRKIWVKEIYKNRKTFGIDLKTLIYEYKCYLVNNPYSSSNCLYIFEVWGIPSTTPAPEVV